MFINLIFNEKFASRALRSLAELAIEKFASSAALCALAGNLQISVIKKCLIFVAINKFCCARLNLELELDLGNVFWI